MRVFSTVGKFVRSAKESAYRHPIAIGGPVGAVTTLALTAPLIPFSGVSDVAFQVATTLSGAAMGAATACNPNWAPDGYTPAHSSGK